MFTTYLHLILDSQDNMNITSNCTVLSTGGIFTAKATHTSLTSGGIDQRPIILRYKEEFLHVFNFLKSKRTQTLSWCFAQEGRMILVPEITPGFTYGSKLWLVALVHTLLKLSWKRYLSLNCFLCSRFLLYFPSAISEWFWFSVVLSNGSKEKFMNKINIQIRIAWKTIVLCCRFFSIMLNLFIASHLDGLFSNYYRFESFLPGICIIPNTVGLRSTVAAFGDCSKVNVT